MISGLTLHREILYNDAQTEILYAVMLKAWISGEIKEGGDSREYSDEGAAVYSNGRIICCN